MNKSKNIVKNAKSKKPILPKLKTILENPLKKKCPTLQYDEAEQLENLLKSFAAKNHTDSTKFIRIGLESTLRAIKNGQSACVLLSQSIKPLHIVGLIARSAEVKDETVPVYVQPQLEELTKRIFGITSMALCLSRELEEHDEDLANWLIKHKRPKRAKITKVAIESKQKLKKPTSQGKPEAIEQMEVAKVKVKVEKDEPVKEFSNDFISFGGNSEAADKLELDEDHDLLVSNLNRMMPATEQKSSDCKMEIEEAFPLANEEAVACESKSDDDVDDFLAQYKTVIVHRINKNPNKKTKKKKNKNKSKS